MADYELYLGDCLPRLEKFNDKEFDAVICDPPYGIGESRKTVMRRGHLAKPTDYGDFDWDETPADPNAIYHIQRVAKRQVIWGGNYFELPPSNCWFIWDKLNGENDFADCEMAWTNLPGATRVFRHMWNGFLRASERNKRVHPAQKPVALMRWVLGRLGLSAGATILDPYMGSGPVGVEALQMGCKYIGIEKDERYFDIALKRIIDAARATAGLPKQLTGEPIDLSTMPLWAEVTE
jgi:DNA modification methylase